MRFWLSILCAAGLAACSHADETRYQFGVSAAQPGPTAAAPTRPAAELLAWKSGQLCTLGYRVVGQDTAPAEGGAQIDDNHIQCNRYRPSLGLFNISWANLF